jgi:ferredoxin
VLLAAVLLSSIISLKLLGIFDPLIIYNRLVTSTTMNGLIINQPLVRITLAMISVVFLFILLLEIWQKRMWCRNLCPLGALISLVARFSLFKRNVPNTCTQCGNCSRRCPMNAILPDARITDYGDCTFCLECEDACPKRDTNFGFISTIIDDNAPSTNGVLSRREVLIGASGVIASAALLPVINHTSHTAEILRPPGVKDEKLFCDTCVICQECVRVCPTGGLRPLLLEGGISAMGTPHLVPRQGACNLATTCAHLCAEVCPAGAIPEIEPSEMKIGLAVVDTSLCLAWAQGVKCLVCVEACLTGAAKSYYGRISVDPNLCTGCGRCESGCPVTGSAIRVKPMPDNS